MSEPTADPDIEILQRRPKANGQHGYIRYRRISNGASWEVRGECDYRGDCLIGAVIQDSQGRHVQIRNRAHIQKLKAELGVDRLISELDVPVTPGFEGCCPLKITEV